jgi:NAD(P)H-dependent FMN reductase
VDTFIALVGSVTRPGRLLRAAEFAVDIARRDLTIPAVLLNPAEYKISFADGRPVTDYGDDTPRVVDQVMQAAMVLIATPVYRSSFAGALKNILDILPEEALAAKVCGLMAMGANDQHYLAIDMQLRPVLTWFGAYLAPRSVYLTGQQFVDGCLADPTAKDSIRELVHRMVRMHRGCDDGARSVSRG